MFQENNRTSRWKGGHVQPQAINLAERLQGLEIKSTVLDQLIPGYWDYDADKKKKRYFICFFGVVFIKRIPVNGQMTGFERIILPVVTNGEGLNMRRAEKGAARMTDRFTKKHINQTFKNNRVMFLSYQELTEKDFQDFIKKDEI